MIEEWQPVNINEETWPYEVSDLGRVRRSEPPQKEGKTYVGKILSPWLRTDGYPAVTLSKEGTKAAYPVHRLVMASFVGPCPSDMEVNHMDRNKTNAHLVNLEYITHKQNVLRGDEHPRALITEEQALSIKKELQALTERYGVSKTTLVNILRGLSWGWLDG